MIRSERTSALVLRQLRWLAGILAGALLVALLLATPTRAQETPVPTESEAQDTPAETPPDGQQTPTGVPETALRVEIVADEEPVPSGETFEAQIVVDNVEDLGAFDFVLSYDPDRIRPIEAAGDDDATPSADPATADEAEVEGEVAQFLQDSPRGETMTCQGPYIRGSQRGDVLALCTAIAPPVCLGGPEGASGTGVLGAVTFESRGGDMTTLRITSSNLVSDDVPPPCDPESTDFRPQRIPHTTSEATVLLTGGGGLSTLLLILIVAVVVVVVLGGGAAGYYLYQQRRGADAS